MRTIAAIIGLVAIGCAGLWARGWLPFSRGSSAYDECMFAEMTGQDRAAADKVCSRRLKREVPVILSKEEITYRAMLVNASITIERKDYNVTRLKVRFAPKSCEDAKQADWGRFQEVTVEDGQARARLGFERDGPGPTCFAWGNVYGTYK